MYHILIPVHSIIRWLLLATLLYCLVRSIIGLSFKSRYTQLDNIIRSATSAFSHVQLIVGLILYFKSPITNYVRSNFSTAMNHPHMVFFGVFHITMMITAILLITIGAAKAKRAKTDQQKHKHVLFWFGLSLLLIVLAIPWPFSAYAPRPYYRGF